MNHFLVGMEIADIPQSKRIKMDEKVKIDLYKNCPKCSPKFPTPHKLLEQVGLIQRLLCLRCNGRYDHKVGRG
jgi:hypothetical protein